MAQNPFEQFGKWFDEAGKSEVLEPNAMNLCTITEKGIPSSRIVLLKGVENAGFIFYTNHQSHKGVQLDTTPVCTLTFFWPELERQVRITGIASRVDEKTATAYFQSRPRDSQVSAWASPQSSVIASRKILEERFKEIEERYAGMTALPKPKQWGGYSVEPYSVEFWQGRKSRLHDRILYSKEESGWKISRLAP